MNEIQKKCCEKCWHINLAGPLSQNYCEDRQCPCHRKPQPHQVCAKDHWANADGSNRHHSDHTPCDLPIASSETGTTTATPHQGDGLSDAEYEKLAEEELNHPITKLGFALGKILSYDTEEWNEKIAPLLREADKGISALLTSVRREELEWVIGHRGLADFNDKVQDRLKALSK